METTGIIGVVYWGSIGIMEKRIRCGSSGLINDSNTPASG